MKFSIIAASLIAAVAAQSDICTAPITITVTETLSYGVHTPSAPASLAITASAPYPTGSVAVPPVVPTGTPLTPLVSEVGTAAPSGTGAYSAPVSEFTGAAAHVKVGGFVAGVGAFAALFL